MLGLGEFGLDNFAVKDSGTMWIVFFCATVLIQLIFLNMLIAIMSESYERLRELQDQNTLKELCKVIKDHKDVLTVATEMPDKRYILVLKRVAETGAKEETVQKVDDLATVIEKKFDDVAHAFTVLSK